eukprot:3145446-Ditylum_brightwellii.AAC.1
MEEWLKFLQNLQAIITEQNTTTNHGMYAITKSILQGNVLVAFKNAEGVNGPQSEPNYKKMMQDVHVHMLPLQAYVVQTWYMWRALTKPYKMSLQFFVARFNKINDQLEQFLPRNDGTPQVKLAGSKLMDVLENAMPKSWKAKICRQHFNCAAKVQAEFISFCNNLKLLDPPKQQAQRSIAAAMSGAGSNQQIPKRKGAKRLIFIV